MPPTSKTGTATGRKIARQDMRRYLTDARQRFDRLIVQQCAVRRFQLEQASTFQALWQIREEVIVNLREWGEHAAPGLASLSNGLASALELFETRKGRAAIRARDVESVIDVTHSAGALIGSALQHPDFVEELLPMLGCHIDQVEDAQAGFNFFDYFSLLGMTTRFDGGVAFEAFRSAQDPDMRLVSWRESLRDSDDPALAALDVEYDRWFHTMGEPGDIDLACALDLSLRPRTFCSPSVTIVDSASTPRLQGMGGTARTLHLMVALDRAPLDIDYAVGYMARALKALLIEEHGLWANVPDHEKYDETEFARSGDPPRLLREKDQFRGMLLGLWCWDLVHLQGQKKARAYEQVREALGHEGAEELPTYLRRIEGFVSPSKDATSALDEVVTQPAVGRLGCRGVARL